MPFNQQQEHSLDAFIAALAEQDNALPEGLQKQLHAIGQNLENRIIELPVIAASLPDLNQAYHQFLAEESGQDQATLVSATNQSPSEKLLERAAKIFTDPDPVQAAQRTRTSVIGQFASNPLKRLFGRG
ncbi:MAG: hypothetical protein WBA10_08255 [Elainellaceae cyanobacterium]